VLVAHQRRAVGDRAGVGLGERQQAAGAVRLDDVVGVDEAQVFPARRSIAALGDSYGPT
jgi:hypothetical protein